MIRSWQRECRQPAGGALTYLQNGVFGAEFLAGFSPDLDLNFGFMDESRADWRFDLYRCAVTSSPTTRLRSVPLSSGFDGSVT